MTLQEDVIERPIQPEEATLRQLEPINRELTGQSAEQRLDWALRTFNERVVLSSSFGAQSAVLLHMVTLKAPLIPVVLIDTGYLFSETYRFIDELTERLDLNLKVYRAAQSPAWQETRYGKLWEQGLQGLETYNRINKVEPMERALNELGARAWIAGLRREQASSRQHLPVLAVQQKRVKVHPIIDWSDRDVFHYLKAHDLPYHPLWEQGYISIGDWHTSHPVGGDDSRFFGLKRECGLHEGVQTDYSI